MVSKYIKALALTIVILGIGLVAINYLDDSRAGALANAIEERDLDLQASQQLFLYESVFSGDDVCPVILAHIDSQKSQASKILSEIEQAEKNRLFPDTGLLKRRFLLQNVELYLLVTRAAKDCGSADLKPVVYFYPDKYYCAECASQAAILDSVTAQCRDVRVFAFPGDLEIPVIYLLKQKYGIQKYPSLFLNSGKHDSLVSESTLKSELGCQ